MDLTANSNHNVVHGTHTKKSIVDDQILLCQSDKKTSYQCQPSSQILAICTDKHEQLNNE